MTELIRDTAFGHLIRFVSRGKYLKFQEEEDISVWTRYIDEKKSGHLAHHGNTEPPEDGAEMEGIGGVRTREKENELQAPLDKRRLSDDKSIDSSRTRASDEEAAVNHASGMKVDPEKGKDVYLVSWYGSNDTGKSSKPSVS